jgi:tetratricopeptide (TPR) repeat protein
MIISKLNAVVFLVAILACSGYASSKIQNHDSIAVQDSLTQLAAKFYAEGNYKKTLALIDTNDSTLSSSKLFYYYGMSYAALYEYQNALDYFKKAIQIDSANVTYHFQFGRLLLQAGFTDESIEEFKCCFTLDSTYLPPSFQLGLLYNAQKKYPDKEVEIFSYLLRQNPNDFFSLYYLGDALRRLMFVDSGIVFVQRSIELNPRYYPSLLSFANYNYSKQEYKAALEYYQKAAEIRAHDKDIIYQTGECLRKLNAFDEAIAKYKEAIAIDSTNATYHAQLGYTYFLMEKFDSSISAYHKAIALDDGNIQYYSNLGIVFKKIHSVQGVIQSYQDAAQAMHPENISFIFNDLAAYCYSEELWKEAAKAYKRVVELNPENITALFWLGVSYENIPDKKSAISTYEDYLEKTKDDKEFRGRRLDIKQRIESLKGKKD